MLLAAWKQQFVPNDAAIYYSGVISRPPRNISVVAVCAPNKGMPFSAVAASKLIAAFRPRYLAMSGICAGLKGRVKIGDVVFADPCWDWGSGKIKVRGGKEIFHVAPYQVRLDEALRVKAAQIDLDREWLGELKAKWKGKSPKTEVKVRVGAVASGASVLQSSKAMARVVDQHKDLNALDMEIFSFFCAAEYSTKPRPVAFALKGVCDYGNERKNDGYQQYSAYVSANILFRFIEEIVPNVSELDG